ncbi:unnamed protein product [Cylicostephanus goldi]|uniref:Uncharacterized protein n=1 Tax=Cylicostephanus goldi TaxID=71465 RepID=A0A3P6QHU8_CYLGO|nr:unnamed protein product [Cylicostephanus goldi]
MVRTYAYNPSSQGNFFGSTSTPSLNQQARQQAKEVRISDVELVPVRNSLPPAQNEQSYTQQAVPACPCQLPQPFYTPFHSPYVDPIGSIVGLRVLYLEGKLCYVPIEPQLNYVINQQFGNGLCMHMGNRYLSQKDDFRYVNNYDSQNDNQNNQIQRQSRYEAPPAPNTTKPQQEQYATGRDMASTFATISTKTRQQDDVVSFLMYSKLTVILCFVITASCTAES